MTSTKNFGAVDFPVLAQDPLGDPALETVLAFAKAILNEHLKSVWGGVAKRPQGESPVRNTYAHNPADLVFNNNTLPALFCWREQGQAERIASAIVVDKSVLQLVWVFPAAQEAVQQKRQPLVNAAAKLLLAGFLRGRDPAWKHPDDTYRHAARLGSFFWKWAGLWRCDFPPPRWSVVPVKIDGDDDGEWRALRLEISVEERLVRNPHPTLQGATVTLQTTDAPPFITNVLELDPGP